MTIRLLFLWSILLTAVSLHAQNNSFQWVKQIGGTAQDNGYGIATDSKGNVYAIGYFQNTGYIGAQGNNDTIVAAGNYDIFLTKMDNDGQLLWAHAIGGSSTDEGHAVTVDADDNVIITGSYRNTVDFDKGTGIAEYSSNNGSVDVFVAKYDSLGNYIWAKTFGSQQLDRGYAVATDAWNNVYVTGQFSDTVTIPDINVSLMATPGTLYATSDVFVCKLNASGNFLWAKKFGNANGDVGNSITVDKDGNPVIVGKFADSVDFDADSSTFMMHSDAGAYFITKWDSAAHFLWAKQLKAADFQGYLVTADNNNNIYLTGQFTGNVDFNLSPLAADTFYLQSDLNVANTTSTADGFVLKLDGNGTFKWVKKMGGSGVAAGRGIALDPLGNPHVVGNFTGILTFDSTAANSQFTAYGSGGDVFIAKYDSLGNNIWHTRYGGNSAEFSRAIAIDNHANVFTEGHFVTTGTNICNFYNGNDTVGLSVYGGYDAYVHKIGCGNAGITTLQETACNTFSIDTLTFTQSGTYTLTYWNAEGCDSVINLELTINYIDEPVITVNNFELGVTGGTFDNYQWLKDGNPVAGASSATFTVTENGNYQVIAGTVQGCSDTSAVYTVTNTTAIDELPLAAQIKVWPNPANDYVYIETSLAVNAVLTSITGNVIAQKDNAEKLSLKGLPDGLYFLQLKTKSGQQQTYKVVKQNK